MILFVIMLMLPAPDGLSVEGKRALAVFVIAVILWISNALPLSVTGLLIIAMIPLLKIMSADNAFALFGNQAVFFIMGAFIIATAMMKSGLSKRMAILLLSHFDTSPRFLVLGILITCCIMSFIMPEHAVAALMFPVIGSIAASLDLNPFDSDYGAVLFLSMGWGAIIGGVGTLLGGARNPLAIAILEEKFQITISFFEWMKAVCPICFVLLAVCYIILMLSFKIDIKDVSAANKRLKEELTSIGPMTLLEKKVFVILLLTICMWIFASNIIGLAIIPLISVVVLFGFHCLKWEDVHNYVNWGIILMYGGAVVIAKALEQTGTTVWLVTKFLGIGGYKTPIFTLIFFAVLAKLLTEGVSNVACVAIILPIALSLCPATGIAPEVMVYFVAVSSGLAFILPISSPPNAIAYSSGYYEISKVLKPGILLNLISLIIFIIMAIIYWPLIGIGI
ncbi:DASS family sodium-coupled anion symporter [bacterium]|nr:DASS family sodium-coupled anion symporter [bacterium]